MGIAAHSLTVVLHEYATTSKFVHKWNLYQAKPAEYTVYYTVEYCILYTVCSAGRLSWKCKFHKVNSSPAAQCRFNNRPNAIVQDAPASSQAVAMSDCSHVCREFVSQGFAHWSHGSWDKLTLFKFTLFHQWPILYGVICQSVPHRCHHWVFWAGVNCWPAGITLITNRRSVELSQSLPTP